VPFATRHHSSDGWLTSMHPSLLRTTVATGVFFPSLLCYHCSDGPFARGHKCLRPDATMLVYSNGRWWRSDREGNVAAVQRGHVTVRWVVPYGDPSCYPIVLSQLFSSHPHAISVLTGERKVHLPLPCLLLDLLLHRLSLKNSRWCKEEKQEEEEEERERLKHPQQSHRG
jgi:hypothetical protein